MSNCRSRARPFVRPARLWPAFALLIAAAAVCGDRRAAAEPFPRDPVGEFRQALLQEKDSVRDKDALRYRRENLTRRAKALTSLGEMARVLLLQEWLVEGVTDPISDIDGEIRNGIADRFIGGVKESLASPDTAAAEAAAELISETASDSRRLGFKAGFLRQRLEGLAPDLAKVATRSSPGVQRFAADALGNIQGDPKVTVPALETLMKTGAPIVRRSAADALGNLVQVVSQQEKRVRGTGDRVDLQSRLLGSGIYVVPASLIGLAADQPVEVRRLAADALEQLASALVDLTPDAYSADKYPPAGRPWTAAEANTIAEDRKYVTDKRDALRPLLDAFAKESAGLSTSSGDEDPYVRIQVRRVLEDLAVSRSRLRRADESIPRGEGVPAPRPEAKPDAKPADKKDAAPKSGGAFLPRSVTPGGVPVWLVSNEQDKPAAAPANPAVPGAALDSTLPAVVAGLSDPNVRARIGAAEVLETMGTDAIPAIPALVKSLHDPDRFVRWTAVRTLSRLAPRSSDQVVPVLATLLDDPDLDVEVAAADALERFGPAAKPAVTALGLRVNRGDADIRIAAMKAIQAIGTDAAPALPAVALNLVPKTREQRDREYAPDAGPLTAPRARVVAAETLGRFGKLAAPSVPVLQQSLTDIDADVRRAASEAILRISGR